MIHKMNLHNEPFELIKNGSKTIELRLYDEKRQLLNEKDLIEFTNRETKEVLKVKIIKLYKFNDFNELYKYFDKISMGYKESETANPMDMERYYSQDEQNKYGVLAIEIELN